MLLWCIKFFRLRMFKRTSTPLKSSIKKKSIGIQTDMIEKCTNFDNILIQGKNMNDNEFEKFIKSK